MIRQIAIKTAFGWISAYENKGKIFQIKFGKIKITKNSQTLKKFKINLLKFFNKKASSIKVAHILSGNKLQNKIWKELKSIKPGHTKSYGEIGKKYGISPRYVGKICGQNKLLLLVPCHRVIKSNGDLGGFSGLGGVSLKKKLLNFENN